MLRQLTSLSNKYRYIHTYSFSRNNAITIRYNSSSLSTSAINVNATKLHFNANAHNNQCNKLITNINFNIMYISSFHSSINNQDNSTIIAASTTNIINQSTSTDSVDKARNNSQSNNSTNSNNSNNNNNSENDNENSSNNNNYDNSRYYNFINSGAFYQMREALIIVLQFTLVTTLIRNYVFDFLGCVGPSMLPTLNLHGDLVIIDFTWKWKQKWLNIWNNINRSASKNNASDNSNNNIVNNNNEPLESINGLYRGDIIVATNPYNASQRVSKRIIGLPGDIIRIQTRIPIEKPLIDTLFGQALLQAHGDKHDDHIHDIHNNTVKYEQHSYNDRIFNTTQLFERFIVVPKGHLWIQGDNLQNSSDSRNYGPIPIDRVLGKAVAKVYPISEIQIFKPTLKYANQPQAFPYHMKQYIEQYKEEHPHAIAFKPKSQNIDNYTNTNIQGPKNNNVDLDLNPSNVSTVSIPISNTTDAPQ